MGEYLADSDILSGNMRRTIALAALLSVSTALPQQRANDAAAPIGNPNVRILSFDSFQNGANFGHQLFQEDGTSSGQKFGPDGLLYGFYSYTQQDGNQVRVYYRAGKGVGYEVIGVEGLNPENLGNLVATRSSSTPEPPRRQPTTQRPVTRRPVNTFIPTQRTPIVQQPVQHIQPAVQRAPATLRPQTPIPVVPEAPTPAPHRFDFPATLNLERTANGFFSSLTAL